MSARDFGGDVRARFRGRCPRAISGEMSARDFGEDVRERRWT
jgi:hypothetical protein